MKEDNTPTVTKRRRTPSRKLRLRLETAKSIQAMNKKSKTVRQKKKDAKANLSTVQPDAGKQEENSQRIPRLKKNLVAKPPTATTKYKRRQVEKTWLPTHLWHTKRARMTRPTEPLWRMAIPLSPTEKSYRPSHRASSSRGCIAWDTSYTSTIGCMGLEASLDNMLKALGFKPGGLTSAQQLKWKAGTRHANGWVHYRDNDKAAIAPAMVIWCVKTSNESIQNDSGRSEDKPESDNRQENMSRRKKLDRRLLIRIHPSAFHQFWGELLKVAKMQKPQVLIEDLRFEIGSIEVMGPGSTEALQAILKHRKPPPKDNQSVEAVWNALQDLNNPAALPLNSMLSFSIIDPRLNPPSKQTHITKNESTPKALNELLTTWPPDRTSGPTLLSSHKACWVASHNLPSQKSIDRRKASNLPGQPVAPLDRDPDIPVMLLACRTTGSDANIQGSWIVLAPWKCIDPIWRSLMRYPLSSGGLPRFGGLRETQQIHFEQKTPWFPGDSPGSEAGKAWERTQSEKRFDEWVRRPPSRRIAWDVVDLGLGRRGELGRGWTCDWEYLFDPTQGQKRRQTNNTPLVVPVSNTPKLLTQRQRKAAKRELEAEAEQTARRRNSSSPDSDDNNTPVQQPDLNEVEYKQLTPSIARSVFKNPHSVTLPSKPALASINITFLTRGTPNPAARIYRLPATSYSSKPPPSENRQNTTNLRTQWLSLDPTNSNSHHNQIRANNFLQKPKQNHHSLPRQHHVHQLESLAHITVVPPDAPQEVIDEFGPQAKSAEQIALETREALISELMKGDIKEEGGWDKHVPCPEAEDLIGFVTSGAYNLSEGRGTAIGSIWVQRVLEGWRGQDQTSGLVGNGGLSGKNKDQQGQQVLEKRLRRDRENHLCIVRNAGESVGRLAVWELCH